MLREKIYVSLLIALSSVLLLLLGPAVAGTIFADAGKAATLVAATLAAFVLIGLGGVWLTSPLDRVQFRVRAL